MTDESIPVYLSPDARMEPVTASRILKRNADTLDGLQVADQDNTRGWDPTIVVAIISGVSSVVAAVLPPLIAMWGREKKRAGRIILSLDDGSQVKFETGPEASETDVIDKAVSDCVKDRKVVAVYLA